MKQLEVWIGMVITSRLLVHFFFCLSFFFVFSISVVLSENTDIIPAALFTCLYILGCTYVGRWCGKCWLSQGVRTPFLKCLLFSFLGLPLLGAIGAAYLF